MLRRSFIFQAGSVNSYSAAGRKLDLGSHIFYKLGHYHYVGYIGEVVYNAYAVAKHGRGQNCGRGVFGAAYFHFSFKGNAPLNNKLSHIISPALIFMRL